MRVPSHCALFAALALVVGFGAGACSTRSDPTSLVVEVESDLTVGTELDTIAVNGHAVNLASAADLPIVVAFTPSGASSEAITITAIARWHGADVVEQSVTTSFQSGKAVLLVMRLDRSCLGKTCSADQTCEAGTCGPKARTPTPYPGSTDAGAGGAHADADHVVADAADVSPTSDGSTADAARNGDGPVDSAADHAGVTDARDTAPADSARATDGSSVTNDGGSCSDNVINGTESDLDCGGGSCPRCTVGSSCRANTDCDSSLCCLGASGSSTCPCPSGTSCTLAQNTCLAPSCNDRVKNGTEADVDCGGICPACADGASCLVNSDCGPASACTSRKCVLTCGDGVQNGNETSTDCGGGICPVCADGLACRANSDCGASSVCKALTCTRQCADGSKDGMESDVDCGGGTCPVCADGLACRVNADCGSSSVCKLLKCTSLCADGSQDGQETDIDCGGGTCAGCTAGRKCNASGDCAGALTCMAPGGGGAKVCQ